MEFLRIHFIFVISKHVPDAVAELYGNIIKGGYYVWGFTAAKIEKVL